MDQQQMIDALIDQGVDAMSEEDLRAAKTAVERYMEELAEKSNSIKSQIDGARSKFYSGEPSDPGWWRRVNGAQRAVGHERQRCQNVLGRINKAVRAMTAQRIDNEIHRRFISAAKRVLPEDTYKMIWAEARAAGGEAP